MHSRRRKWGPTGAIDVLVTSAAKSIIAPPGRSSDWVREGSLMSR